MGIKLTIYRHTPNTKGDRNIIGDLHIDGVFYCYTLEDEIRPDGIKIKHKTAIPTGIYKVILTVSNRFKRLMPLLVGVKGFSGVRLHGGNDSEDSSGCPLVAFNTDYVKIWGTAEKRLTRRLEEAENITIEIKNSFLSYNKELHKDEL